MKLRILIRSSRFTYLCFFFLFSSFLISGQELQERSFIESEMDVYADDPDFGYMNYTVQPPSIWERLSWWFQNILQRIFLNPNTPWLTQILYYMILILVVGAAIFYIIKLRYGKALTTDYRNYGNVTKSLELQNEEDFDLLINEALSNADFKLAVRYVYLKTLMMLSKNGIIALKDWKSPYDYEKEIGEQAITYRELARTFEYVWYGDFDVVKETYENADKLGKKLAELK